MAIIGNSGSGKSTFLNMIGGLDRPSAGKLYVDGKNLFQMSEEELVEYKRSTVGFVWQNNARNLLPYLTAWENVMTPMLFMKDGKSEAQKKKRAEELLELVGLAERKDNTLSQLSGGEQQRVCIARALVNEPPVIFADEPTGNLDEENEQRVLDLLTDLHRQGRTIVMVTHNPALGQFADRILRLQHGKYLGEEANQHALA